MRVSTPGLIVEWARLAFEFMQGFNRGTEAVLAFLLFTFFIDREESRGRLLLFLWWAYRTTDEVDRATASHDDRGFRERDFFEH